MKQKYKVHYNKNLNLEIDQIVEVEVEEVGECPNCHKSGTPTFINGYLIGSKENDIPITMFLILYCTSCRQLYIARYSGYSGISNLFLNYTFPNTKQDIEFNNTIAELSPEFVSIYNQSLEAESNQSTTGLAGLGYRKALEFLIKDYLIKEKQNNSTTIKEMQLSNCIDKLDGHLQVIAKAATWLGNDETHYFRKHEDYNIEDLKDFIMCLVKEIEHHFILKRASKLVKHK